MNNKKERIDEKFQERRNNDWMWRIVFSFFGGAVSFLVFITGVTPYILVNHDEYLLKSDLAQDYVKKEEYDNLKDQLKKLGTGSLQGKNINGLTPGNTKESGGSNIINNEKKIDYSKLNIIDEMVKEFYKKYGAFSSRSMPRSPKDSRASVRANAVMLQVMPTAFRPGAGRRGCGQGVFGDHRFRADECAAGA